MNCTDLPDIEQKDVDSESGYSDVEGSDSDTVIGSVQDAEPCEDLSKEPRETVSKFSFTASC
jgi:hypothetical protein